MTPRKATATPTATATAVREASAPCRSKKQEAGDESLPHLIIECVTPELDGGRFDVKRVVGDSFRVGADIFKEGHDKLAARIRYRAPEETEWQFAPLAYDYDTDRWSGGLPLDRIGRWTYTVEAWTDIFGSWRSELEKKLNAGQDVSSELLEGAALVDAAARGAPVGTGGRGTLQKAAVLLRDATVEPSVRGSVALAPTLLGLVEAYLAPRDLTTYDRELHVWVDRERARFASWYEFFPRSCTTDPRRPGTFADAERFLDRVAELGFDVAYLPPIHPIGVTSRKGRNNALVAEPDDPGSPWAIGNEHGGHDAVDPNLGTIEDFDRFVARAHELGMEVALDYALQCSPDHPWLKEHPEWFFIRPDGTLKYAENPPKKYQDIYPLNFWSPDREALWTACRDVLLYWVDHGVRTFRVDNPHTKPLVFWEWVIAEVRGRHPEVIFLAEAFTRPKRMKHLAKLGFSESYTYFTWKNTARELREFVTDFFEPPASEYYRGNLFANTPDILTEYLVLGGRNAFRIRLLLAGTLSSLYGIYSGFELSENVQRPGSEEYIDNEKYEIKVRDWDAPGNLSDDIRRLNQIRRENAALQLHDNVRLAPSDNVHVLFYTKSAPGNDLLIAVNLDPHRVHETMVTVPLDALDLSPSAPYTVEDLLTGARYVWRGARNYVRLDPWFQPGHVLRVVR